MLSICNAVLSLLLLVCEQCVCVIDSRLDLLTGLSSLNAAQD